MTSPTAPDADLSAHTPLMQQVISVDLVGFFGG